MTTALRSHISDLQRSRSRFALPADTPKLRGAPDRRLSGRRSGPAHLGSALEARVHANTHGELLVWEKAISEVWSHGTVVAQNLWSALDGAWAPAESATGLQALAQAAPDRIAWLDIETAGFIGRPVFLIGIMRPQRDDLVVTQLLAADYSQERALLAECAGLVSGLQVLVTFNGKCFDLPFLRDRMAYHRVAHALEMDHVDLLHPARRQWRGVLPDCRLQTLERHLCRRMRAGDIPSALIPERYHEFVRTRDPSLIAPVMRHNRLDLLTMAELSALLLAAGAERDAG